MAPVRVLFVLFALLAAGAAPPAPAFAQSTPPADPEVVMTGEFGPVPAGARDPAIPAEGFLVEEIVGDLYWVTDGLYQAIFLSTDASAAPPVPIAASIAAGQAGGAFPRRPPA